jgi:hypothetical protein
VRWIGGYCSSVNGTASLDNSWAYECIDTLTELERYVRLVFNLLVIPLTSTIVCSCGGCASTGEGVDCTALPGVKSVTCNAGQCQGQLPLFSSILFRNR